MNHTSLSIPFFVLSTKLSLYKDIEIHLLTPFGLIEITLQITAKKDKNSPSLRTEMDIDTPFSIGDTMTCDTLKASLIRCVQDVAHRHYGGCIDEAHMHLKVENRGIPLTWKC